MFFTEFKKKSLIFLLMSLGFTYFLLHISFITYENFQVRLYLILIFLILILILPASYVEKLKAYYKYDKLRSEEIFSRVSILRFESRSYLFFGVMLLLFFMYPFNKLIIYIFSLSGLICILLTTGIIWENYKINKDSKKSPFSDGQKRFFPGETVALKNVAYVCVKCMQVGFPIIMMVGAGFPKIIYGVKYRPPLFNYIAYPITGIISDDEVAYGIAIDMI